MSAKKEKWQIKEPKDWQRQLDNLPLRIVNKVDLVLADLASLADPRVFGVYERNLRYGSAYVLRLDKSHRLSYRVDFESHIIILGRVGDHKSVGSKE